MQLPQFVIMCSFVLIGWLGLAFVHPVASLKDAKPSSVVDRALLEADLNAAITPESEGLAVSVSP